MTKRTLELAAVLAAFAPAICSQEIIGITTTTPTVVRQQMLSPQCAAKKCVPLGFETQVAKHAGGTAYDSRIHGTWVTNGRLLANIDPWKGQCRYICPPRKIPLPPLVGIRQYATGLAYCDSGPINLPNNAIGPGWLFASYNTGYIARMDVRRCTVRAKFCKVALPAGSMIAGLATDDVNRRLFIGVVTANGSNLVLVSNFDQNWCRPTCRVLPRACSSTTPLGPLSGLAFDPCRQRLYITDGKNTGRYVVSKPPFCALQPAGCCPVLGEPFSGLCFLPKNAVHSVGKSCTTKICEICPTMRAEIMGEPVLGNPFFGVALRDAPNKTSMAVLAVGFGACSPVGINFGFCENIRVPLPLFLSFFAPTPIAAAGCNRNISVPWKVPLKQNLCGLQLSFQWVVVCKGNPTGRGVTNCVDFIISGS